MPRRKAESVAAVLAGGMLAQSGGCQVSGDTQAVIQNLSILAVTLVRDAILSPVDRFLTNAAHDFFDTED